MTQETPKQWLGYPEPTDTASIRRVSPGQVASLVGSAGELESHLQFQIVDVRRSDLTGTMVKSAINLPAHSFYPARYTLARIFEHHKQVIFYCGSSQGRGPRCAGWLQEAAVELGIKTEIVILDGGIKGFIAKYGDDETVVQKLPQEVKES